MWHLPRRHKTQIKYLVTRHLSFSLKKLGDRKWELSGERRQEPKSPVINLKVKTLNPSANSSQNQNRGEYNLQTKTSTQNGEKFAAVGRSSGHRG